LQSFLNDFTFEVDLFYCDAESHFRSAVTGLSTNEAMHKRFAALAARPSSMDPKQFLKDIESLGKGRVAQRLATIFQEEGFDSCPSYIEDALSYLKSKLG
jgi:putative ATP-dependent endonuclease of the OLD family